MGENRASGEGILGGFVVEKSVATKMTIRHLCKILSVCTVLAQINLNAFIAGLLDITKANLTLASRRL